MHKGTRDWDNTKLTLSIQIWSLGRPHSNFSRTVFTKEKNFFLNYRTVKQK
jgi:hypothetical protein